MRTPLSGPRVECDICGAMVLKWDVTHGVCNGCKS